MWEIDELRFGVTFMLVVEPVYRCKIANARHAYIDSLGGS